MSRTRKLARRQKVSTDPKYNSKVLFKFINIVMRGGKKSIAQHIMYTALGSLNDDPDKALSTCLAALGNVKPVVEVRSRRVGGSNYQIPIEVPVRRQQALAMRWILNAASNRKAAAMSVKLADELRDAAVGKGAAVKKREETLRMAESNRAFSHFRW